MLCGDSSRVFAGGGEVMSVCWQRAHEILHEILYEILHVAERTCHVEIPFVCVCVCVCMCVRVLRARAFNV
jgi:hypothetical protein